MKLQDKYKKEILPKLIEKFAYQNRMEAPKLLKVVLNVGFGRHVKEKAYVENVVKSLEKISGQKPVLTKAKKSISSFKVREGMVIGASVTMRGARMYDFVEKLVNISFPRVRDFRGISAKSVDRDGNLTIGFKEHIAFPEIGIDDLDNLFGLEVCLATSAKARDDGFELFNLMGFPFKKE
jgi:large subunit ribosomal protein L5